MKVVVTNFSGNTGKSTVARHLLAPRLNKAQIIAVESINSDGTDGGEAVRGRQFDLVSEAVIIMDDVVVDVGASNVEDFLAKMRQYRGSHEDFDHFVVPVVPEPKQMRDTIATICALADEIGIPAGKIRVVFNKLEPGESAESEFDPIFRFHEAEGKFTLAPSAVIHASDIFGKVGANDIREVAALDVAALKAALAEEKDSAQRISIGRQIGLKRLAEGVLEELDAVFRALFPAGRRAK